MSSPVLFKKGVRFTEDKWTTWFAMGVWHALSMTVANKPLVVTSGNDGKHKDGSKHYTNDAFDARVRHLTDEERRRIVEAARRILTPLGYAIISQDSPNPTLAAQHRDHDHIQYSPRAGQAIVQVVD